MAKTDTLEKLVPHVNSLENIQQDLKAAREEVATREAVLREEIAQLRNENFELRGSIGGTINQPALALSLHIIYLDPDISKSSYHSKFIQDRLPQGSAKESRH